MADGRTRQIKWASKKVKTIICLSIKLIWHKMVVEVTMHAFLSLALHDGDWWASSHDRINLPVMMIMMFWVLVLCTLVVRVEIGDSMALRSIGIYRRIYRAQRTQNIIKIHADIGLLGCNVKNKAIDYLPVSADSVTSQNTTTNTVTFTMRTPISQKSTPYLLMQLILVDAFTCFISSIPLHSVY